MAAQALAVDGPVEGQRGAVAGGRLAVAAVLLDRSPAVGRHGVRQIGQVTPWSAATRTVAVQAQCRWPARSRCGTRRHRPTRTRTSMSTADHLGRRGAQRLDGLRDDRPGERRRRRRRRPDGDLDPGRRRCERRVAASGLTVVIVVADLPFAVGRRQPKLEGRRDSRDPGPRSTPLADTRPGLDRVGVAVRRAVLDDERPRQAAAPGSGRPAVGRVAGERDLVADRPGQRRRWACR